MADALDGKTPGTVPSKWGIMCVESAVLHPDKLQPEDFCDWYEKTHIQEVHATGGISRTCRYESLDFTHHHRNKSIRSAENQNCSYDFVTVYHMPDLAFRETAAFRGLAGQSTPDDGLVNGIFKQAEFCTRFCEELESHCGDTTSSTSPSPFLVTIGARSVGIPSSHYISSLVTSLSQIKGKTSIITYKVHEASKLSEFNRSWHKEPTDMVLIDFVSEPDTEGLLKALQDWEGLEVGFWSLRRAYDGNEQTPDPWKRS